MGAVSPNLGLLKPSPGAFQIPLSDRTNPTSFGSKQIFADHGPERCLLKLASVLNTWSHPRQPHILEPTGKSLMCSPCLTWN